MLLIALVEMRRRTERPSASEISVTLHRFGKNRRLVFRFRVADLVPNLGAFGCQFAAPRHSEILVSSRSSPYGAHVGSKPVHFQEPRTYKGPVPQRQGKEGCFRSDIAGF